MRRAARIDRSIDGRVMRGKSAFGELELAEQNRAGLSQAGDDGGVTIRGMLLVNGHAGGRGDALGVTEVLHRNRNAMQGPANRAEGDLAVGLARLRQRQLWGQGGIAPEAGIEPG